jgi:N-methylhydantoinase A
VCSNIAEVLRMPATAVESGLAAGAIAAALAGRQLGRPNLISFDMDGTTAKASLIVGHEVAVTAEYEVGGAAKPGAGCAPSGIRSACR